MSDPFRKMKAVLFRDRCLPHVLILVLFLFYAAGCAPRARVSYAPPPKKKALVRMGYAIQAGAFASAENAARLTQSLKKEGLDAYYFVHPSGIYKVRFGNYPTEKLARSRADALQAAGVIDGFYIVKPGDYAVARTEKMGSPYLRSELIRTAESFIGVPYLWGGTSSEEGLDCSGLTMAVYQYNGLDLPRSSREQFDHGTPVERSRLQKGDLVFFKTSGVNKVSHVGIYVGNDRFIHAPGRGKKIGVDSLSKRYFARRYAGARSYI
jgi:cell wall-associated NlpC family hydrolase